MTALDRGDLSALAEKWFAVGIPGFVMLVLVLGVASLRLRSERSHIPASRKRSQP